MPACNSCGNVITGAWKFCRYCGSPAQDILSSGEIVSGLIRQSNDIFIPSEEMQETALVFRMPVGRDADINGRAIAIEDGQKAVIARTDMEPEVIGPQTYSLAENTPPDGDDSEFLLFRKLRALLDIEVSDILSQDPLPVTVRCSLDVEIEDPATFSNKVFVDGNIYTSTYLADWIYGVIESICRDYVASQVIRGFRADHTRAEILREQIILIGSPAIERFGLRIAGVPEVSICCPVGNGNANQPEDLLVSRSGDVENQITWAGSINTIADSEMQTFAEETVLSSRSRGRAAVWERLLRRVMCTSRVSTPTIDELGQMSRESDVDGLIDPAELRDLGQIAEIDGGDPWKSKAFLIRRLGFLRDHERANTGLIRDYCLSEERLVLEFQQATRDLDMRWTQDRNRLDFEIEQRREYLISGVGVSPPGHPLSEISVPLKGRPNTRAITSDQEALNRTVESGLRWYEQYRSIGRDDDLKRMQTEVAVERERQFLALEKERALLDMRLEESAHAHRQGLEKIDKLSQTGIETLIALSGPEQGELLLQLSRTRALSRFKPDEILSLQAASSPEINEALREILTAITSAGKLDDYELITSGKTGPSGLEGPGPQQERALNQLISEALDMVNQGASKVSRPPESMSTRPSKIPSAVSPDGTVTLLFSDIKGSTDITERLGDRSAQELFGVHNSIVRQRLNEFDGYEVKSMGDGFMLAFSSARMGIMCAVAIQRDLQLYNEEQGSEAILVRMGLHTGEVIKEGEDYFGRNVILASRISAVAREDQVLVSALLKGLVDSLRDFEFGDPMRVDLKGLAGTTVVYPVNYTAGLV